MSEAGNESVATPTESNVVDLATDPAGRTTPRGVKTRARTLDETKYILTTIGMNEEQIDHLVTVEGIRRVDILEMMTLDQVKEIPSHTDTMAMGDALLLIRLKQWCSWYRKNPGKGKLPHVWELVFDEDTLYEFDVEASQPFDTQSFESARAGSKKKLFGAEDLKDDESIFKVKLSGYPKFDGKQSSWLNFKKSFEAIAEAAGFTGEMQVSLDDGSH